MDMRRASVVLALAVAAVGCSSDHKITPPQPTTTTVTSPNRASAGVAAGHMHITGGRPRKDGTTPDQPLPGTVEVRPAGSVAPIKTITVDATGKFRISLAPGRYALHGQPRNTGIMAMNSKPFTISAGGTTAVDLVEYAP